MQLVSSITARSPSILDKVRICAIYDLHHMQVSEYSLSKRCTSNIMIHDAWQHGMILYTFKLSCIRLRQQYMRMCMFFASAT